MSIVRYISHPDVAVDPRTPVPEWSLNARGRARAEVLLTQPWMATVGRVVSSAETKALELATLIAYHLGVEVEVRTDSGEIDRSAVGYVTHDEHEALAERLFASPGESADGWEPAFDAQRRIIASLADVVDDEGRTDDAVVVGHGAVGTLLLCQLAGLTIDRQHDQPGQGHYWAYDRTARQVLHRWRAIDDLEGTP